MPPYRTIPSNEEPQIANLVPKLGVVYLFFSPS